MRSRLVAALALSLVGALSGAAGNPFFRLNQTVAAGKLHIVGTNISQQPIVAYVVVAESAHQRAVWHGRYTAGDSLRPGKTITVGDLPAGSDWEKGSLSLDYLRLADGTTWGSAQTDDAKEIAASFAR